MRRSLALVVTLFATVALAPAAEALTITPSSPGWTTNYSSNINTNAEWWLAFGYNAGVPDTLPDLLYKSDVGGVESGSYAGDYSTTYTNTPSQPSDALIKTSGGFFLDCSVCFLLVKDGNQNPAQYLFNISSWNGTEELKLTGFWPANGSISHIQILGSGTRVSVPEPSTIALLGSGLAALYLRRRRVTA